MNSMILIVFTLIKLINKEEGSESWGKPKWTQLGRGDGEWEGENFELGEYRISVPKNLIRCRYGSPNLGFN